MRRIVTAFEWVPDFAQGNVRDLRVRWALEEAGFPYDAELLAQGDQKSPEHVARQPFGQVPTLDMDGEVMFESGAIVWRIATEATGLLPDGDAARWRCLSWLFAALNSVEPPIMMLAQLDFFEVDDAAADRIRPSVLTEVRHRLAAVDAALGDKDHLTGGFTVADLVMATVLNILRHTSLLDDFPRLAAYRDRCFARPAYVRALSDHMRPFAGHATK